MEGAFLSMEGKVWIQSIDSPKNCGFANLPAKSAFSTEGGDLKSAEAAVLKPL